MRKYSVVTLLEMYRGFLSLFCPFFQLIEAVNSQWELHRTEIPVETLRVWGSSWNNDKWNVVTVALFHHPSESNPNRFPYFSSKYFLP